METTKQTMRRVEGEMMTRMIKQARARWAGLPAAVKTWCVRQLEDGAMQAAKATGGES